MAMGKDCTVHHHDDLVPIESHHVWPLGYHGPNTKANQERVCANGHSSIHYLLEAMLKGRHVDLREFGPGVRRLAFAGYVAVMDYADDVAAARVAAQADAAAQDVDA